METFEGKITKLELDGVDINLDRFDKGYCVKLPEPIGYLEHKPTHNKISVYSKMGLFKRLMIKYFF